MRVPHTFPGLTHSLIYWCSFGFALLSAGQSARAQSCGTASNPVVCENALPGTTGWQINGSGNSTIQGFATDISVNVGQSISFKVKTNASNYRLDIYRMGYYGGAGARKITTVNPSVSLPQTQPACITDATTKLYDCGNWAVSASWTVPATAASGIYFAVLVRADTGGASQIFFVVRNDSSTSDILFQTSDETWQAYNPYGGNSLYGDTGWNLPARAYKVSYNRPFTTPDLETWTWVFNAEYPMVRWLESNGYNVSYSTGVDAARNGALIKNHKLYLSVGHDEYWSAPHRASVEAARDAGVNLAFFSGNEVFWKTRWENSTDGSNTPYRTLVCYKETLDSTSSGGIKDPLDPPTWTGTWRDPRYSPPADGGRPENGLTGTIFMVNGPGSDNTLLSMKVPAADGRMRFWRNTSIASLAAGQTATLPAGTLGYEWDSELDNGARPAGLFHLSTSTYNLTTDLLLDYGGVYGAGTATHNMTLYRAPSGALVFGAGTVQWAWGLDSNHDNGNTAPDVRMQQATVNLFADMGVQPATMQAGLVAASKSTDITAPFSAITFPASGSTITYGTQVTITGTATDNGGGVIGGVEVSVDGGQTWHPATGRESWTYSWNTSTPNSGHLLSRAVDDSANIETPNAGVNITVPRPSSPISIDTTAFGDGSVASSNITTSTFSTTAANELLLAFISSDYLSGTNTTVTNVTGAGLTWTLVKRTNAQSGTAEIWRAFATAPLTSVSITATLSQSVVGSITVQAYTGVDATGTNGSGAIGAVASGSASSGAPTAQLVTTRNNSWVVGVGTDFDNAIARVPQAGQSLVHQYLTPAGDTYWVQAQNAPIPLSGTTATISDTSPTGDRYNLAICEILPTQVQTWTISGTITPASAGSGATVMLSGTAIASVTADASGNYSFVGLAPGSYVVTPSKTNFTFTPPNQSVAISAANATGINFTAVAVPTWNISGTITPSASGSGTTVTLNSSSESGGANQVVTADSSGNYTFTGLANNTYTITPSKPALSFAPTSQSVTINGASVSGVTFTATAVPTWSISGTISPVAAGSAATVTLSGTASGVATADGSGNFSFTTLANGTYTVTPSKSGFTFAPTSQQVTLNGANASGVNFTGTTPPPLISGLSAVPGANGTATVTWTTTTASTSRVDYGTVSTTLSSNVSDANLVTSHTITLTGLTNGSTYYFRATSTDALGGSTTSPAAANSPASFVESTPVSIWSATAAPTTPNDPDTSSTELGLKFRSDVAGIVTGVRFYKGAQNTGTHIGNLWNSTGTLLATVTFSGESASGWQQANFGTPVAINPNTTYIVSYFAPGGHYADDAGFFASTGVDNAPLHALANGVDGSNGVYAYSATSAFPSSTFSSSNYWVDLVFSPTTTGSSGPVISAITVTPGTTTATIAWSTNVASTSHVDYGTSATSLSLSVNDPTLVTTHGMSLTGLTAGTTYYYRVTSTDASSNSSTSPTTSNPPSSFATLSNTPPVITGLTAIAGTNGTATVTWTTNTASSSRVDYGTTTSSLNLNTSNATLVTSHSITLTGLTLGTTYYYRATSVDAANNSATSPAPPSAPASFAETAVTTASIWPSSTTPGTVDSGDPSSVELGTKFRSDIGGTVTGIRFYKSAANTGTHIGNLWSSTGTLLASVTFTGETASGWQQAAFSSPVTISPNTTYVVSYFAPAGHYSVSEPYFNATSVDNPPLHALADGTDGGNGVYQYGTASAFPSQTYNSSNYWVDVVFSTTTSTVFPTSATVETGTLSAGTAARLNADDNSYYQVNSTTTGTRVSAWYGSFPAVPKTLRNLTVTYKGKNSRSCTESVSIWSWASSSWVQLDSRAVGTTEVLRGALVPTGVFSNYVNGTSGTGELRVEVRCSTTAGNVTSSGDVMAIEYDN